MNRWRLVQRSTATALVLTALAACYGASLVTHTNRPVTTQHAASDQRPVDRRRIDRIEPRRAPSALGERAMDHVQRLVDMGPRNPGNPAAPGWSMQLDYITDRLQALKVRHHRDTWTDRKELITFTNVIATIPGKVPERILLACHHDTKCTQGHRDPENNFHFVGANDGGSGVALLLELARVLRDRDNVATVQLVFFDGEESLDWRWNDGERALFGSKRFVTRHRDAVMLGEEAEIRALILLDMVGRTDLHIQEELYSTPALRSLAYSAAVACGHERHFFQRSEAASDDHTPFLDAGIPAVDLIDLNGNPHWHKQTDTIENMSAASIQKVADVVLTMLPEVERMYVGEVR